MKSRHMNERPQNHNVDKNYSEKNSKNIGVRALVGIGIASSAAAVLIGTIDKPQVEGTAVPSHELITGEQAHLIESAEAMADRYESCEITDVIDTHKKPERSGMLPDIADRTTLEITLSVNRNDDANKAAVEYHYDDSVLWQTPTLQVSVAPWGAGTEMPVASPDFTEDGGYVIPDPIDKSPAYIDEAQSAIRMEVYPRSSQPDGAEITFVAHNDVRTVVPGQKAIIDDKLCQGKAVYHKDTNTWTLVK